MKIQNSKFKAQNSRLNTPYMLVSKEFSFDAAHNLINYHGSCEKLHGHTWKLQVTVCAPVGEDGLAFDFVELKKIVNDKVVSRLDHAYLNDLLMQSSAENLAIWIWEELKTVPLYDIKIWETPTSWVTYYGPEKTRRQKAEGGRQKAEGGRQKAEGRRRKAEGGRQKAEGGRQKAEGRRQKAGGGRRERKE